AHDPEQLGLGGEHELHLRVERHWFDGHRSGPAHPSGSSRNDSACVSRLVMARTRLTTVDRGPMRRVLPLELSSRPAFTSTRRADESMKVIEPRSSVTVSGPDA